MSGLGGETSFSGGEEGHQFVAGADETVHALEDPTASGDNGQELPPAVPDAEHHVAKPAAAERPSRVRQVGRWMKRLPLQFGTDPSSRTTNEWQLGTRTNHIDSVDAYTTRY